MEISKKILLHNGHSTHIKHYLQLINICILESVIADGSKTAAF